jgi:DNA-binding Lrp family transcriptional regulator
MDEIDRQIIAFLSVDARTTVTDIAHRVHRSRVAVQNRIDSLIRNGEIVGFGVLLKRKAVPAMFEICLKPKSKCEDILPKFKMKFNVNKAWSVAGNRDLFIWTEVDEVQALQEMRSFLSEQPEILSVSTHIVIKTYE